MTRYNINRKKRKSPKYSPHTKKVLKTRKDGVKQHYWKGRRQKTYTPRCRLPDYPIRDIARNPLTHKMIKKALIFGAINVSPVAREIYWGYTTCDFIFSSWKTIYSTYQDPDRLKENAYGFVRTEVSSRITNFQTGIVWDCIEDKVPEPLRNGVYSQLNNVMSNVTEGEISLVENALSSF